MEKPLNKKVIQPGSESKEELDYISTFDELVALGAPGFSGKEVTFQPVGRYDNERQKGTVRKWEEEPDLISIYFMGSKVGVPYPDSERITREDFDKRKNILKIRLV